MLKLGEILTLDDNKKYSVVYSTELNEKNYVYLIDQNDYNNYMFCEFDGDDGLVEVMEPEIVEQLLVKFEKDTNKQQEKDDN